MGSKRIVIANLTLRIFTLLALAATVVVMVFFNSFKDDDGKKTNFTFLISYRFVVATAVIGFVYTAIQIPFAVYQVTKDERMIRNGCLPEFDFYGDQLISYLLATGVGAGFFVTMELKRFFKDFFDLFEQIGGETVDEEKFLNRGYIAVGMLFLGFIFMAITSILSSISRGAVAAKDAPSYKLLRNCM